MYAKLQKLKQQYATAVQKGSIDRARRLRDQIIKLEFDLGITGG